MAFRYELKIGALFLFEGERVLAQLGQLFEPTHGAADGGAWSRRD